MFQGSELSVETTGAAFVPILNALDYNLFLPGNWEVIWGRRECKHC
jgi:2',3'-cyclic-nucleotide 2'-phosphodiesterase (5'-nucleotidase family)